MNSAQAKLLLVLLLAAPCVARADDPPPDQKSTAAKRAEDIEVMRRILNRALNLPRYSSQVVPNPYGNQDLLTLWPKQHWDGWPNPHQVQPHGIYPPTWPNISVTTVSTLKYPSAEGVYLKNQGVIFTLTLPPQANLKASPPAPANKTLSEWERVRKEIRGEKIEEPEAKPAPEPTVVDVILKVLAENGTHLSQLGPDETVTVVVTFRNSEAPKNIDWIGDNIQHQPSTIYPSGYWGLSDINSKSDMFLRPGEPLNPWTFPGQNSLRPADPEPKKELPSEVPASAKDNILLGDLHSKQGKYKEAVEAYENALKALDPTKDQETYRQVSVKLARILLALDDAEQARQILEKALGKNPAPEVAKPPVQPQPAASPLPAKLIISAPKKLLDQVGDGKITLEEFKKQATIDLQTFTPEKAGQGEDKK